MTALEGIKVVDLSDSTAGAYGTKLLAALGADVVKVEPPGSDATRALLRVVDSPEGSILGAYLHTGKRSVMLDPDEERDRMTLNRLLRKADLIVESGRPKHWAERGIDLQAILDENPRTVLCSVTPYGQTGPCAWWHSTPLTAAASGGQMALCGDPGLPPLKTAGDQAGYQGGLHVFSSSVVALLAASRSGVGDHIDLSLQEIQAASLEGFGPNAMVRGLDAERAGNQARATWGIYPCADGHVGVSAMRRQTPIVYECIGHPELAEDPAFLNILADPQNNELVQALVLEWTASRTQAEIYEESGRLRAPFAVVETPETLLASEHLQQTGFWSETPHPIFGTHTLPGVPFKIDGVRPPQRRAPLPGEHTGDVLFEWFDDDEDASAPPDAGPVSPPLEGIRVLDLTQVWAGPYAARFLADMGADVIHIEGPDFPDAVRGVGRSEEERSCDTSPYFNEYNRNKRGIVLDLNRPEGIDAFKRMVRNSDVVMENWSVGVAERLGIGYEELRALNPRLIFVQMPAFGCEGPEAERVGFGPNIEQMGGLVSLQGYEGAEPHKSGISYGDPNGGTLTAGVIAAALFRRDRTREGAHVVVIQRENIVGMIGEYVVARSLGYELPSRLGNRHPDRAPHGVYRTRDDSGRHGGLLPSTEVQYHETWLALDVQTDQEWESLKLLLGDARLDNALFANAAGRAAAVGVIDAIVGQWARDRDPNETAAELQAAGIAASPVLTPLMLTRDAHLEERGYYPTVEHPVVGRHRTTRPVWRLTRRPFTGARPGPTFGQDNVAVLTDVAGLPPAEVSKLHDVGVIADVPTGI